METQSPGAGPSRSAPVHNREGSASISTRSSAPYHRSPAASSRSLLLEAEPLSLRSVASVAVQVDPVPLADICGPEVHPPPATQATPVASFKFGPDEDTWCKCKLDKEEGRNLVVCIDGTANQFGFQNTNVVELYSRLDKNKRQLTYYNSGIGTYVRDSNWLGLMKQALVHGWDMAVAWNLKKIILDAYRWLSENYQHGDCIFLFGFSRGAYQVRIIGGMIEIVGLLHKGNNEQIAFRSWFYKIFRSKEQDEAAANKVKELSDQFKQTLSHKNATVHFIGVWDTVSSVGIARGPSFPETTNGMKDVCGVRHVLSLDEERDKFQPEYVNGGAGPEEPPESATRLERDRVKEVWFVGSHSDIGGGNSDNIDLNNFGPALRWMIYEALRYGLKIKLSLKGWGAPERNSSMTWVWRILEVYPFRRLTYKDKDSTKRCILVVNRPPHLCRGRRIQEGQRIHVSVARYMKETPKYVPAARIPSDRNSWPLSWNAVRYDPDISIAYEQDAASPVIDILTQLRDASKAEGGIKEDDLRPLSDLMLRKFTSFPWSRLLTELLQSVVVPSRLSTQCLMEVPDFSLLLCNTWFNSITQCLAPT
ncbi:hypothetical protein PHLGIDRAFT_69663 [Phlebiopsis gigantea 11061_1 CR5-6]|uniref:T6SS Phospholipase effector Tle1-like catalytic domain-containing protein n=1 Tax=Phlebiopsis gigantea (strain 11061_1 CR5-6) TaxID=745531 RepID=A0A0C3S057_PHLG1|nr:hypothetical protein PHLGIDRAFT_69663 [Phlebiopsis gigantea 11061_1 CR5-6]